MNLLKKVKQNEQGSATIEFIGIVPIALIALAVIIQIIVGMHSVMIAQSAANEYASVYSVTENHSEAAQGAQKIIDSTGDHLTMSTPSPSRSGKDFTVKVPVKIGLKFIPKEIFGSEIPQISFTANASGRVIK